MENNSISRLLSKFARELQCNIPENQLESELEKHPNHPSILAISDVLTWFGVKNGAYHIKLEDLPQVPVPFIAHTKNSGNFALVSEIRNGRVTLTDIRRHTMRLEEFKKLYQGVVLAVEATEHAVAVKIPLIDRLSVYRTPAAVTLLAICFLVVLTSSGAFSGLNLQLLFLLLVKTAGLAVACLLLLQSIDKNNPLVQTLCGGEGKTNCNAILTSKAAMVFKGLTWSEVGFFYYAGSWLTLLFLGRSPGELGLLAILNILSLPYTIYSINYQARIAKQWCRFCVIIQAMLWLEFASFLPTLLKFQTIVHSLAFFNTVKTGSILLLPVCIWLLVKPLLLKGQQLNTLKSQLQKFKYNKDLFDAALKEQPKYTPPADDWSINLGDPLAETVITMVSNPYCQPCAKTHNELNAWLEKLDSIQLRIVFTADNSENDKKTPVTRHLMALSQLSDKLIVTEALHDWYNQNQKNYEAWAKVYPVVLDESKFSVLERQRAWCDMAEVKVTPTLLVNGYRLPEAYRVADIKYMLGSSN